MGATSRRLQNDCIQLKKSKDIFEDDKTFSQFKIKGVSFDSVHIREYVFEENYSRPTEGWLCKYNDVGVLGIEAFERMRTARREVEQSRMPTKARLSTKRINKKNKDVHVYEGNYSTTV